jgi:rhodanese-related sulfurtransferase
MKLVSIAVALFIWVSSVQANESIESIQGVTTVSAEQALALHQDGALFIDVRNYTEWMWGHIEGALHLDLRENFNEGYMSGKLDAHKTLVLYCESPLCFRSAVASFLISMWGFENVYYFRDGYFSWLARDYPSEMLFSDPGLRTAAIKHLRRKTNE